MNPFDVDFELTRPMWLLGLLVVPVLVWFIARSLVDLPRRQMICSLVVRSTITLLLVLALAGLTLLEPTRELFVIFAVDSSLSVDDESRRAARDFTARAAENVGAHGYRVLPFAVSPGDFQAGLPPGDEENAGGPKAVSDSLAEEEALKGTNLQAAIEVAAAGVPPHYVPRLVLLTDGNETTGDARRAALQAGLPIWTVPLATRDDPEIQVSSVNVPAQVARGEPFNVEVVVDANHEDEALVEIYAGEHKIVAARKPIKKGENRFVFTEQVDRPTEFAARISRVPHDPGTSPPDSFRDTLLDNNTASGLVFAAGKPRVLLVESVPELARNLEWALGEEGIVVDTSRRSSAPRRSSRISISTKPRSCWAMSSPDRRPPAKSSSLRRPATRCSSGGGMGWG